MKADEVINAVAVISIIIVLAGLLIGIWFGAIGIKIAASGAVIFIADWLLYLWSRELRKEIRRAKNENKNNSGRANRK